MVRGVTSSSFPGGEGFCTPSLGVLREALPYRWPSHYRGLRRVCLFLFFALENPSNCFRWMAPNVPVSGRFSRAHSSIHSQTNFSHWFAKSTEFKASNQYKCSTQMSVCDESQFFFIDLLTLNLQFGWKTKNFIVTFAILRSNCEFESISEKRKQEDMFIFFIKIILNVDFRS